MNRKIVVIVSKRRRGSKKRKGSKRHNNKRRGKLPIMKKKKQQIIITPIIAYSILHPQTQIKLKGTFDVVNLECVIWSIKDKPDINKIYIKSTLS